MTVKNNILEVLKGLNEPINTKELAELCNIDKTNIAKYLKPLEAEGKITRKRQGKNTMIKLKVVKKILQLSPEIKPRIKIEKEPQFSELEMMDLLMCVRNYLKGYKHGYQNMKYKDGDSLKGVMEYDILPETIVKYERIKKLRKKFFSYMEERNL